ncbi:MAG: type IX secretion system PorP/SprF family membrane protein [Arenicella sp.]|jgi:type IX secretion system PorP/SprF family membrane protein
MKLKLTILSLILVSNLFGQLTPIRTQYMFNGVPLNPALTGSEEAWSISGSFRAQWIGFPGAPLTQSITAHSPLKNESSAIGLQIFSDQIGIDRNTGIYGSYAYRIKMKKSQLSFGVAAGVNFVRSFTSQLATYDSGDQQFSADSPLSILPNTSVGVYYGSKKFFASISIPFMLSSEIKNGKNVLSHDFKSHNFLIGGGMNFDLGSKIKLKPSLLLKYNLSAKPQLDVNLMAEFNKFFEAGVSYRTSESIIALLRINPTPQLGIMYSFGLPLGDLLSYSSGSHEIGIKYTFLYKTKAQNPRYLKW